MTDLAPIHREPFAAVLLSIADDKLILGHRNSDWTGVAPLLEEDIAFSSLAQDDMAHAQALYELAGELLDKSADQLAFGRPPEDFLCASIVELPDEYDWAVAIARQFFCDHFDLMRLERLSRSSYKPLADLAGRLHAEQRVHVEHVSSWIRHLGNGTDESRARLQKALDLLAPHAAQLFEPVPGEDALYDSGVIPPPPPPPEIREPDARALYVEMLTSITEPAGVTLPDIASIFLEPGGRTGRHTEHLAPLLDDMCSVHRLEPNAAW
jgi:ring-1,2-phenylacetyl-CoA epoxidase subunit PaaC